MTILSLSSHPAIHIDLLFSSLKRISFLFAVLLTLQVQTSFPMTFQWVDSNGNPDKNGLYLELAGDIRLGDYERFRTFVRDNLQKWKKHRRVRLPSNGGNLVEAIQISNLLRAMYPTISVEGRCASACFFLYLSGSTRYGVADVIGIHRAYFDPEYFADLKPNEAKRRQTELTKLVDTILDDSGVPQALKDKMQQTSSATIYWLSAKEIESLGRHPAWYEELLIAKCNYKTYEKAVDAIKTKQADKAISTKVLDDYLDSVIELINCENNLFEQELGALNRLLAATKK